MAAINGCHSNTRRTAPKPPLFDTLQHHSTDQWPNSWKGHQITHPSHHGPRPNLERRYTESEHIRNFGLQPRLWHLGTGRPGGPANQHQRGGLYLPGIPPRAGGDSSSAERHDGAMGMGRNSCRCDTQTRRDCHDQTHRISRTRLILFHLRGPSGPHAI